MAPATTLAPMAVQTITPVGRNSVAAISAKDRTAEHNAETGEHTGRSRPGALLEAGKSDGGQQSRTDLDRSEYGRRQVLQREEEANKADCRPEIEKSTWCVHRGLFSKIATEFEIRARPDAEKTCG